MRKTKERKPNAESLNLRPSPNGEHAVGRSPETQAVTRDIGNRSFGTAPGSRPAPAASRLQFAPPVDLLARVGKGLLHFPVALDELDPCQVRPSRPQYV